MGVLMFLLSLTIIWPFIAKYMYGHEITIGEFFINLASGMVVVTIGYYLGVHFQMADTEILNGEIVNKHSAHVSCSHSYRCNPHRVCSGSGKNRSCYTAYDTCYEHPYDVSWYLDSNIGESVEIDRVDRRGLSEPPRYSSAVMGEPFSTTHSFDNYVKAAPDSLFNKAIELKALKQYEGKLPAYPDNIYDYHRINRVISTQTSNVINTHSWDFALSESLKKLGPALKMNGIIVVTSDPSPTYATALRAYWLGAKINDAVLVIGSKDGQAIDWVRVFSWTDSEMFKVKLRDAVLDIGVLNPDAIISAFTTTSYAYFKHKRAEDFSYLKTEIEPPMWAIILLAILGLGTSIFVSIKLGNN